MKNFRLFSALVGLLFCLAVPGAGMASSPPGEVGEPKLYRETLVEINSEGDILVSENQVEVKLSREFRGRFSADLRELISQKARVSSDADQLSGHPAL